VKSEPDGLSLTDAQEPGAEGVSRRRFLGGSSVALATAALSGLTAQAQQSLQIPQAEKALSISNPGPENHSLFELNPHSNVPPPTDRGDIGPVWYSFDLAHKRVQEGGWTHEVNSRVLPTSEDLSGFNMRLTAGSFRELHWHTADEWAIMLYGNARVTVMNPDGSMFIDMWLRAICGCSRQGFPIPSRDSSRMVASFFWYSMKVTSRKTVPFSCPSLLRTRRATS